METMFLTAPEVAQHLRISLITVRRLTMLKQIPFCRVGRRVLYPIDEIHSWLKQNSVGVDDLNNKTPIIKNKD